MLGVLPKKIVISEGNMQIKRGTVLESFSLRNLDLAEILMIDSSN